MPVAKRSEDNIHKIASIAGKVLEVEKIEGDLLLERSFVRAKIALDVRKQLKRVLSL